MRLPVLQIPHRAVINRHWGDGMEYLAAKAEAPHLQAGDGKSRGIPKKENARARVNAMKRERQPYEKRWRAIRDYQLPFLGDFDENEKAERRDLKIVNGVAWLSCQAFAAGIMSGLTPPSRQWFKLAFSNGAVEDKEAAMVLDTRQEILEAVLHGSNFYNSIHACYMELPFGQAPLAVYASDDTGVRFQAYTVGTYYLSSAASGRVNTFARQFEMTAAQLAEQFGKEALPVSIQEALSGASSAHEKKFKVWHLVMPNASYNTGKDKSGVNMPYLSLYWTEESGDKAEYIYAGGFEEFPVPVARYQVAGGEVYGKGPGWYAEGESKGLQLMKKDLLTWVELSVKPAMKAPPDILTGGLNLIPGGITQVNELNGSNTVGPLFQVGSDPRWLTEEIIRSEDFINRSYSADLFLMLDSCDTPQMTAREVMERQQEKLQQLGPVVERLQDEFLTPIIERCYNILERAGVFPPIPADVAERLAGADVKIEYISPLAQAQKMSGLVNIEQALSFVANMGQLYPEALKAIDPVGTVKRYFDLLGAPAIMQRSAEEIAQMIEEEQKMAQRQQEMAMEAQAAQTANVSTQAARNLMDASADGNPALQNLMGVTGPGGSAI